MCNYVPIPGCLEICPHDLEHGRPGAVVGSQALRDQGHPPAACEEGAVLDECRLTLEGG